MELYFPIVLDGANGTELLKRGYDGSMLTEKWVLEHPEVMKQLQSEYADAGSDIVYSPTFGVTRVKLEENGIFNMVGEYNKKLVKIARDGVQGRTLVAGDIPTTGKFLAPVGDVSFDDLYDIYHEQAAALEEAGVDLFVIETLMTVSDARAALLAVKDVTDKPVIVSFTCDENGRTLTGTDVAAACVIMQGMGIDAFGLNCGVGPKELLEQFRRLRKVAEVPLLAKPNAGLPKTKDGKVEYDCPPEEFASYIRELAANGVCLFGGCCGTGPDHVRAVKEALADFELVKPQPEETDGIRCATEKDVFVIEPGTAAERVLACGPDLAEEIRKENRGDAAVIAVKIAEEADLDEFADAQYAVRKPLCIVCDDAGLLDEALRLYQGRAIYAGELPTEELMPLVKKYGLII